MADNVTLPGTGAIIATDEVDGDHVQIIKLAFGADGTATVVATGTPLPVAQQGGIAVTSLPSLNGTQVAVTSLPALPAGGNNIGDVDVASLPALPAGSNLVGKVDVNEFPASSRTTDTVGATTDVVNVASGLDALPVKFASISTAASGYTSLVAAVTGRKIRVLSYALVATGAVTAQFASDSLLRTGAMALAANGGVSAQAPQGLFETVAGAALRLALGAAVQVSGHLSYVEV